MIVKGIWVRGDLGSHNTMKYTLEKTNAIILDYKAGIPVEQIADNLSVPVRSVIAKLSSLGVYQKKRYLNKRGELPEKKAEIIEKLAELLECDLEMLDSLEKVNKSVLQRIIKKLS